MAGLKGFFSGLFSAGHLCGIARTTRFSIHSASKLSVVDFVRLVLGEVGKERNSSLNHLANVLGQSTGKVISKQGLDKRFSAKSVDLLRVLFEKAIGAQAFALYPLAEGLLDRFGRIRIKDGTRFDLDPAHEGHFPGFGGKCTSKSGMCVQFEYDLKSQSILEVGITSAKVPDRKNSDVFSVEVLPRDLVLRDLGYFSLDAIGKIIKANAYVVTKLNTSVKLHTRSEDGGFDAFDFQKVLPGLGGAISEMAVFVGGEAKIPMRLVITAVGVQVRDKRIRNANKEARKKGYKVSDLYKLKAGYNFLLTNIGGGISAIEICKLYRLRWQVELVFKNFKSVYGIHKAPKMKFERWMTLFYAKLLITALDFRLFSYKQKEQYLHEKALLSIQKVGKTLVAYLGDLLEMIGQDNERVNRLVGLRLGRLGRGHRLEKRKNRIGIEEILFTNT